ncbi:hypothetical protein FHS39_000884 [Streptomyces olivoverticillatus]|uniref:DUF3027 domain-containing protein n=1 Tax=Streptomyces olivoverticillatus TaxID=66427 RepID=A0A7W7LKT4_9ACTN|nr:DUF3027 domain-containing protein [Streptomyces olivoverticillatus]MBB4891884.1 hypothetical protein [Streptomyces olivoverticillatus]
MRSRTPDRLCAEAVELARAAAEEAALPGQVGEHVEVAADGDRVVTHYFLCLDPGYRGWRWAVTVARASRAKHVTLDEAVLLPGPDALLAPEWVPWSERLRPGDMGPGDLLPTESDDLRLEPGFTGEEEPPPNSAVSEEMTELAEAEDADVSAGPPSAQPVAPARGSISALAEELGMRRARVLSRYGLHSAADRWDESYGAKTQMAQAAPASCVSCGFLAPIGGSLGQAFGVCANEFSPADGHVVSLSYGCGGHSEAARMPKPPRPAPPVIDETLVEPMPLRDEEGEDEDLGHA